jgi:hypothetical protein
LSRLLARKDSWDGPLGSYKNEQNRDKGFKRITGQFIKYRTKNWSVIYWSDKTQDPLNLLRPCVGTKGENLVFFGLSTGTFLIFKNLGQITGRTTTLFLVLNYFFVLNL